MVYYILIFISPIGSMNEKEQQQTEVTNTRSSADADNRLDAFSGQSRSTNMVPFHMLHIVLIPIVQ